MHGQTTISDSIVLLRWSGPPIRPQECVCLCILFFVFVHLFGVFRWASYQVHFVCVHLFGVFGWASYQVYMPLCIFLRICVFLSGTAQMVSPTEHSINLSDTRSVQLDSNTKPLQMISAFLCFVEYSMLREIPFIRQCVLF